MATHIWRGDGIALAQTVSRTFSGTWEEGDVISIDLNGKVVSVTVGTSVTPAEVASLVAQAWNGESLTDAAALVSPLDGGGNVPEFAEITAQVSGAILSLIADVKGVPFDNPDLTTDSEAGDLGSWSTVTGSEGPNHWDTAANWDTDTVPATGDTVVIPAESSDILHGLDQSAVTLAALQIEQGYTGRIGLPELNASGGYDEYRGTYLQIGVTALTIGGGTGQGSQRIKIDLGSVQSTVNILNSGIAEFTPAILLKGTHASNVINITKGSLGVAYLPGETSAVATIRIGYISNQANDAMVILGPGVTLTSLEQSGGVLTVQSATTSILQAGGTLNVLAGAHAAILQDGGACFYSSTGTLTLAKVGNASTLDLSRDMRGKTITNCEVYASGAVSDPFRVATFTNGLDVVRTSLDKVRINLGSHFNITPAAI